MINERDYLAQVHASTPRQFANILRTASGDAERVLRVYFGDAQFERMQTLARNMATTPTGTVVLLPGILGSELHENGAPIWISPWNLIRGDFDQLRLDAAGRSIRSIQAPNPLKKYYGEMQLALLQRWNVLAFAYDWRLDITLLARRLKDWIDALVPSSSTFSIIGHSLGGLVARSYLQQFPEEASRLQRFIMLGTPNYGSFAIPVLYNGLNEVMKIVALLDTQHYMTELLEVAKTFMSTYQMLPSPAKSPDAARLMSPVAYGTLSMPPQRFNHAEAFQQELAATTTMPAGKSTYIAGFGFKTPYGVADWSKLQSWEGYHQTQAGDGTVPHGLGLMDGVMTYFVHAAHTLLAADGSVIAAVEDILANGSTTSLPTQMPQIETGPPAILQSERTTESAAREVRAHALREIVRLEHDAHPDKISVSEMELQELIYNVFGSRARTAIA